MLMSGRTVFLHGLEELVAACISALRVVTNAVVPKLLPKLDTTDLTTPAEKSELFSIPRQKPLHYCPIQIQYMAPASVSNYFPKLFNAFETRGLMSSEWESIVRTCDRVRAQRR
jgi:hypothetical protein